VIAVLIPSAFHFSITTSPNGDGLSLTDAQEGNDLLSMSHAVAILLLILYLGYLLFQMWTHAQFYEDETVTGSSAYPAAVTDRVKRFTHRKKHDEESAFGSPTTLSTTETNPNTDGPVRGPQTELANGDGIGNGNGNALSGDEDDEEQPQMNMWVTVVSPNVTRPELTADRHDHRYRPRRRHGRVPRQQH
jgi:Ca2+:H+ antiporter